MRELIFKSPFDITAAPEPRIKKSDAMLEKHILGADEHCTCVDQHCDGKQLTSGRFQGVSARKVKCHTTDKLVIRKRQGVNTNG